MKTRIIIGIAICLTVSVTSFGALWGKVPEWLSPAGLQRYGAFHWGVLGLCLLWLWIKRRDILPRMRTTGFNPILIAAGAALLALSLFLPRRDEFLVFLLLLGWLGAFTAVFGRACLVPAILLAIYGFSVAFPLMMTEWLGGPSAVLTTRLVTAITTTLGLPITSQGTVLRFDSLGGETVATVISPGCAGYATIGVFIALFCLMMLDTRLPPKKAWHIFLIGLAGTWLQNILRILVTVGAGYLWGAGALAAVHNGIAYIIFPLWYALFAFIYLGQAGRKLGG